MSLAQQFVRLLALKRARWPRASSFGLREVCASVAYGSVAWLVRHLRILDALEAVRPAGGKLSVLDFGGGTEALARVMRAYRLEGAYEVTLVDVDTAALAACRRSPPIVAVHAMEPDARALPFDDGAFDACVSSDVFEHIPHSERAHWAAECRRLARTTAVHTIPCDGGDGRFDGSAADRDFEAWYRERFGESERFTREHLDLGVPTFEELTMLFPGARLHGFANTTLWRTMLRQQFARTSLPGRLVNGLWYRRQGHARAAEPPFKSCLVVEPRA